MNRRLAMMMTAVLTIGTAAVLAQQGGRGGGPAGNAFQQFGTIVDSGQWTPVAPLMGPAHTPVTGSPVSATEERRTKQTLGDGTVIERSDSNKLYRDSQGRTRTEQMRGGKMTVIIYDPVAGFSAMLDPETRTARRTPVTPVSATVALRGGVLQGGAGVQAAGTPAAVAPARALDAAEKMRIELAARQEAESNTTKEDLGMLHQNGVPAQGTRTTMTIAAGKIGNNREIKVVNERWYSNELQMLVKSVNADPRFGTTTYELANILRTNPDAGLFQIPADYTVTEGPGGRGRGGFTVEPAKK